LQEVDPGRTLLALQRLDVTLRNIRPGFAGYEGKSRGRKPPELSQAPRPATRLFCAVAFFETFCEFGDPLAENRCELVVFEVILEHFDHLWCTTHKRIRLADGPIQEATDVVVVEWERAPEHALHGLTDRQGLVEGRGLFPVPEVQPLSRGQDEPTLLLLACLKNSARGR
jgi:hypothetical protein